MSCILERKVNILSGVILILLGCANTELLEQRITRLEQENSILRKETTDLNIKLEETNNILYVIQDKITEQAKAIEELKARNVTRIIPKERDMPSVAGVESSADELYKKSLDLLHAGKAEEAERGFREFIEKYPEHPNADNAQYWLGECYYSKRDYNSALQEFNLVLTNYSKGDKICDATLKIGYSYIQLGDIDNGVKYLKNVISNCSNSPVAKKAEEKLKLLERN